MIRIVGIALLFVTCLFLLRELGWRGAPVLASIGIVSILALTGDKVGATLGDAVELVGTEYSEHIASAIKVLGVSYLFGISSDVSRTLGEPQVAKVLDVVGRVEILAIIMPFLKEIIRLGVELI